MFPLTGSMFNMSPFTRIDEIFGKSINTIISTHVETVVLMSRVKGK
jgi:hypothetical protein